MMNSIPLTRFAASVAESLGVEAPHGADAPLSLIGTHVSRALGGRVPDRALIFNPDCIGHWFWQKHTQMLSPVQVYAPLAVPFATMMPSVTPVCFGTMYTGVTPAVHGIRRYEKPVITHDSLFDAFARAGKRVTLLAAKDSSMAIIFGGRPIDYRILPYDDDVNEMALKLIEQDEHDVLVVYNQSYDDMIHMTAPEDPRAMKAAQANVDAFCRLCAAAEKHWAGHDTFVAWAPDHGNHIDWDGHGNHGEFREEDINIVHFFGGMRRIQN